MSELINGVYNKAIEVSVGKYTGERWRINNIAKNDNEAMHDTAIFNGNGLNVFVKVGKNPFSHDQFIQEAWGLKHIKKKSLVTTPDIIDVNNIDGTALLILEAVNVKPVETKRDWEILGRGLATLHKTTWDRCGLETHSYLGIFKQDNQPMDNWVDFYAERRLRDSFSMVVSSGKSSSEEIKLINSSLEKLISKLPEICGPVQPFSLLHGDPWIGNLLYDGEKLILIDCSIYYGNREIDLSTVDFFCPVPEHFLGAYHECYPIEPDYEERKSLWRINQWLGHVILFGSPYMPKLMDAINKYL